MSRSNAGNALLIIDVQRAIDDPSWGRRNNPNAEHSMHVLLEHWRAQGWPIVHVRHESREADSTYRPGQPGCEFKPQVQPQLGEWLVTKHVNNAFIGTDLDARLKAHNIGSLVICGVITNNSVEATARMAGNLGYLTYVVSDATATFDRVDLRGDHHSAERMHAISLANLANEYASIVSTDEILRGVPARAAFEPCKSLDEVRANLDRIDRVMIGLIAERGRYVREAARFKSSEDAVRAPARVEQVIAKVRAHAEVLGSDPRIAETVYRAMIDAFIQAELEDWRAQR